jgi:WD40 repeat protein
VYTDEKIPEYSENGGKRVISTKHATCATAAATAAIAVTAVTGKTRDICFVIRDPPFSVVCLPPDPLKENPKMGLSRVVWSFDSSFIAIKSDSMPCYVWIWHTETLKLHAMLSFLHAVTSLRWDPEENRLAIAAGENRVHLWTKEGISWIDVPCYSSIVSSTTDKNSSQPFKVLGVRWHPKGKTIAAFGRFDCCTITL